MNLNIFSLILLVLVISACNISVAGTINNPEEIPPYEPIGPYVPTIEPSLEPTFTVEPTMSNQDGWISVDSVPSDADVYFDDGYAGITPVLIPVSSTLSRSHTIRVSKNGYQDWSGHISGNPGPGETIYQTAYLIGIPPTITVEPTYTPTPTSTPIGGGTGWFSVDSSPSGADVYFDGSYYGSSPIMVKVMTTATPSHTLLVRMNGYQDYTMDLPYNPGQDQTVPLYIRLTPLNQYGSILVTSSPSGALATLDSGQQYLTSCTFTQVLPGTHTISVSLSGYQTYTVRVQVNAGTQARADAPLIPIQTSGTLYVDSQPQGADVKIDNTWKGQTPLRIGNLIAGYHTVKLQLSGYQTASQQALITAGQETPVSLALIRDPPQVKTGSISVASIPPDASVSLNNDYQGLTPAAGSLDIIDLTPGSYTVSLQHPDYQSYVTTVAVIAGQITPVNPVLTASSHPSATNGTLSIASSPAGAQVFIDNLLVGVTPLVLPTTRPGVHTLLLKMNGYQDYSNEAEIKAGMTTTASVNLSPVAPATMTATSTPTPLPSATTSPLPGLLILPGLAVALLLFRRG
ncbi:MAG TPA: PEGA domain-containing protein [Methanospirillum sp.]|nr:PEGA domain-containing protein [Methanospirillum sp.]